MATSTDAPPSSTKKRPRKAKKPSADHSTMIGHSRALPYLLSFPSIFVVSALLAFPVVYAAWGSLFSTDFIGGPEYFVGLENYLILFQDQEFISSIWRTFVFVSGTLVIGTALGLMFAFALNRAAGKLRFLRGLTIVPYLVSGVATAVVFRLLLNQDFGAVNNAIEFLGFEPIGFFSDPKMAMLASILAQVWADLPLAVLLMLGGLQTIEPSLLDAAAVDGANGWSRAWRISIPLIGPQIALSTILLSYQALTSLGVIVALTGGGPVNATRTLPIALYETAFLDLRTNEALAIVIVILLLNAALTLGYIAASRRYDLGGS